ncbi:MAG: glucose-1-phosphate cytidylyltransferase [Gemmatimonadales bacterium]|nr:glucose-1-phosphate cytidylyltransferase [Gemmatimonadales bacterium]
MKAVILAGGYGTRLSEETHSRPKPMVEIGGRPMLWHIMKMYSTHDVNDFIICCGYRGYMIKEYFANFSLHMSDITFDLEHNTIHVRKERTEPWRITLIDTGEGTLTGGRLKRVADYVEGEDEFCMTYGDGLSDIDISATITFHREHGRLATVTAVKPPGRFGALELEGQRVTGFMEKPTGDEGLINGGFFVLDPHCLDLIDGDDTTWEDEPLTRLATGDQLRAYEHHGFWQPMDTVRERNLLEDLWASGGAPWKTW